MTMMVGTNGSSSSSDPPLPPPAAAVGRLFGTVVIILVVCLNIVIQLHTISKSSTATITSSTTSIARSNKNNNNNNHNHVVPYLQSQCNPSTTNATAWEKFLCLREETCPLPSGSGGGRGRGGKQTYYQIPPKEIGDYTSSTVYLVGDSVIGQLGILGRPGLCCNGRVPCSGGGGDDISIKDPHILDSWIKELNATNYNSIQEDWQHLNQYIGRGGKTIHPNVLYLAPSSKRFDDGGANLVATFLQQEKPKDTDILIAGLMGNHYHMSIHPDDDLKWETFTTNFILHSVNKFPGRVILLGASPQHYPGDGTYYTNSNSNNDNNNNNNNRTICGPFHPSTHGNTIGTLALRSSIWDMSIHRYLYHNRTRVLDVFQVLSSFWMCHRVPIATMTQPVADCTHWNDGIYSMLAGMVLEALESME